MKISLAQIEVEQGNVSANLDKVLKFAKLAKGEGSALLCLPELVLSGFNWQTNRRLLTESAWHLESVSHIARTHAIALCASLLEATEQGGMANTLFYIAADGSVIGRYRKIHLFSLFQEERHVEPGGRIEVIDTRQGRVGFGICYDLRFPELFRKNAEAGAFLQILLAAFPHPRLAHWQTLVRARAIENQCFFAAVNQVGFEGTGDSEGGVHYFGHSMLVDPWGNILVEGGETESLLTVTIDPQAVTRVRSELTAWEDRRPELFYTNL